MLPMNMACQGSTVAQRSDGDQTGKDAVAQRAWYGNTGLMQVLYRSGPVLRR